MTRSSSRSWLFALRVPLFEHLCKLRTAKLLSAFLGLALLFIGILPRPANAANYYWWGGHDNNWNTTGGAAGTNWSTSDSFDQLDTSTLPGASDNVYFVLAGANPANLNTMLGQSFTINSLNFTSDAVSSDTIGIGGSNLLTIGTGGLTNNGAATITLSTNVALGGAETWDNNSTTAITISGALSGSANLTLEGTGATSGTATGGFVFSNANSYSGQITLANDQTSLDINGSGSFASVTGATAGFTLNGGSSLILDNTSTNSSARLNSGVGISSNGGTISLLGNSAATAQTIGTLTLGSGQTRVTVTPGAGGATLTLGSASVSSFNATHTAGASVDFSATGTIAIPKVTLDAGGLIGGWATIGNVGSIQQDSIGSGNVLDFATVNGSGNAAATTSYVNHNTAADFVSTNNVKVSAAVTLGTGTITANSLYVTGNALLTLGSGTLVIGDGGIISNQAALTFQGSGPQVAMTAAADIGSGTDNTGSNTGGGAITGNITSATGDLVVTTASNLRMDTTITNDGSTVVNLTKDGSGVLDLSDGNNNKATNSYTGITTINGGLLIINNDPELGTAPGTDKANAITFNGGELRMTATITLATTRGITVGPQGGTLSYNGGNTTILSGYQVTGSGSIAYDDIPGYGGSINGVVGAPIDGNLCAMKIDFAAVNYTGGTTFLTYGSTAGSGNSNTSAVIFFAANNQTPISSPVTVTTIVNSGFGGFLNLFGTSQTFGSLAGNGNIYNGTTTTANLTVGQDNLSTTYSGNLGTSGLTWAVGAKSTPGADESTSGAFAATTTAITLTKVGSGTMTMSGTNGYTGATAINGGTLLITGSLANTAVSVGNGTLLGTLGGSGSIAGPVTVTSTGALSPDVTPTTTSTLTLSNGLTLNAGASLDYNFGAAGSPGASDLVKVTAGNISLASGADTLNITALSGFGIGTYDLITNAGSGTFTDNATFTINGSSNFNYAVAPSGSNLVLTVTAGNPSLFWAGAVSGAANGSWDNGVTSNWTTSSGSSTFASGDNVTFDDADLATGGATSVTVTAGGVAPNTITFNNSTNSYTFGGGAITVASTGSGITMNQSGSVTFNDSVSTPLTAVKGGTLTIGSTGSLNSTTSVSVSSTGAFVVSGSLTTPSLIANGPTTFNNAAQTLGSLSDTAGSSSGPLTLNGTALTLSGTSTYDGIVAGSGSLRITGGTLTLTNAGNTYSGGTTASGGATIVVNADGNLGTAPSPAATNIALNNATLQIAAQTAEPTATLNANRSISIGTSGATINIPNAGTGTFNVGETAVLYGGVISGGAGTGNTSLTVTGGSGTNSGTNPYLLELGGQSTYTGNTSINNATVAWFNGGNGGTGPANVLPSTTVLNLVNNGWFILNNGASSQQIAGLTGDATGVLGTTNQGTAVSLTILPATGQSYEFDGVIGPVTLLARAGNAPELSVTYGSATATGAQILGGANTYTATTAIAGGTLQLGNGVLTTGSLAPGSAITIASGATLAIDRPNAVTQGTDFSTASITGAGAFAQIGIGTTTLNVANGYSGGTTVSAGTLTGTATGAFGTGNVTVNPTGMTSSLADNATLNTTGSIAATATVTVNSEPSDGGFGIGTVNFNGTAPQIGALNGNGSVVLNNAVGTTLTVGNTSNNLSSTFSGTISNGAGAGGLATAGSGILTLSGPGNTYTGTTNIAAGTLRLSNATSTNNIATSATISLSSAGATLDGSNLSGGGITLGASSAQNLNGIGTVLGAAGAGTTTVNSGGFLSPGLGTTSLAGTIGTLTFGTSANGTNGNLALNSGATLNFVLGSPGASPSSPGSASLIAVNGSLTLPTSGIVNLNTIDNNNQGGLGSLGSGYYELFSFTGSLTNPFNSAIFTQSANGVTYTYTDQINEPTSPNQIDVQVTATSLTWTGLAGNTVTAPNGPAASWDIGGSANWANGATTGQTFSNGAIVTFGDSYTGGSVTNTNILIGAGGVKPAAVFFTNNGVTYTLNSADSVGIGGASTVVMQGTGTVNLAGPNSFSGGVGITSGVINIFNAASLGNSIGVTLGGGVLQVQGGQTFNAVPLIFNGPDVSTGALNNISGANTYPGSLTMNVPTTIGVTAGSLNLTGTLSGSTLTLASPGNGQLTLSGSNGLFTGGVTVASGTLNINNAAALGTGTLTLDAGATIDNINSGITTLSTNNAVTANGSFTFNGTNSLNLGTDAVTITGNGGAPFTETVTANANTLTVGGPVSLAGTATAADTLAVAGAGNVTIGGTISNGGGTGASLALKMSGTGTLTLSGTNTYTGTTTINSGVVSIAADANLGTAPGTALANSITLNGGTLRVTQGSTFTTTAPGTIPTINANRGITLGASGGTINAPFLNTGNFDASPGEVALFYAGVITGGAGAGNTSLTITGGSGTNGSTTSYLVELGGQSNYTGNTTINNVSVCFYQAGNGGTGPSNILPTSTVLNLVTNGWFVFNNGASTQQITGLTGDTSGRIGAVNTGTVTTLTIAPTIGTSYTFNGIVGPIVMPGKTGAAPTTTLTIGAGGSTGTEILTGANTYGGTLNGVDYGTTLNSGTLGIDNASAIGVGTFTINGGAIDNVEPLGNPGGGIVLSTNNPMNWNANFAYGGTGSLNLGTGAVTLAGNETIAANAGNAGTTLTVGGPVSLVSTVTAADTLAITGAGNVTLGGVISNGGTGAASLAVTMSGAGTLVLGGANTYSGGTNIQNGTLRLGASNSLPAANDTVTFGNGAGNNGTLDLNGFNATVPALAISSAAGTVAANQIITNNNPTAGNPSTLTFNGGTSSFGGTIQNGAINSVALTVAGGTLTLTGSTPYSGATTINSGGTLALSNSSSNNTIASSSSIALAGGALFNVAGLGAGANTGVFTLGSGATAQSLVGPSSGIGTVSGSLRVVGPGSGVGGGTLAATTGGSLSITGGLSFTAGSIATFTLPSVTPNSSTPLISVGGALTPAGSGSTTINITNASLVLGTYDLIGGYSSSLSSTSGFTLSNAAPMGYVWELSSATSPNQLDLIVELGQLTWTGANGGSWDTLGSQNWANTTPAATGYADSSQVLFGDTNPISGMPITNSSISIQSGGVNPASVSFTNNTVTYTIDAGGVGGSIAGNTGISMTGTGTVNLAGANSFTGPVSISAGIINISNNASLGNSSGVSLSGGTLQLQGNITTTNAVPLTFNGPDISTGALNNLSGANTYTGGILLNVPSTIGSTAGTLTLSGGGINNSGNLLTFTGAGNTTVSAPGISGGGGLTKAGAGTLTLSGTNNSYSGPTTVNAGTLRITGSLTSMTGVVNVGGPSASEVATSGSLGGSPSLGGSGTIAGSVEIFGNTGGSSPGHLAPSGFNGLSPSMLNIGGNLTLDAGAVLDFNLFSPDSSATSGLVTVSNANDYVAVAGSLISSGGGTLNINDPNGLHTGTYVLATFGSGFPVATGWGYTLTTPAAGLNLNFSSANAGQFDLIVTTGSGSATWTSTGAGLSPSDYGTASNWTPGTVPDGAGQTATFGAGAQFMVSINSSYTLGQLNFNNGGSSGAPTGYLLTGNGNLTLNNSGSGASVNVSSGSLTPSLGASVTLTLADSSLTTTFNIASGSSLTLGGAIGQSSSGQRVVLAGGGTLELESPNTYSGSTTINSGTLQIDSMASIAHTSSVSIGAGGTLQLVGTTGALPSTVNIATHGTGSAGDGALVLIGAATETVGTISGDTHQITDGSQQVTVYSGNTTVGDGSNAASLTATQILGNTLTINSNSTVTIAPSGSGIPTDAVAAASSTATSDSTADSDSSSDSTSDPFTAIQEAISSGSISSAKGQQLENRIAAIERLAATDPGLDVSLLETRVLAALPVSSVWSSSGTSPLLDSGSGLLAVDSSTSGSSGSSLGGSAAFAPAAAFGGSPAAVPEPSTLLLAALGSIGFLLALRRRAIYCQ